MGFEVVASSRLEDFFEAYPMKFSGGLFSNRATLVLQNKNLRDWLIYHQSDRLGSLMGLDVRFSDEMIRDLIPGFYSPEDRESLDQPLYLDSLKVLLFEEIRCALQEDPDLPELAGLRDFCYQGQEENPARIFSLAQEMAGIFHGYAMNAPEVFLDTFPSALASSEKQSKSMVIWQAWLWKRIFGTTETKGPYTHVGVMVQEVLQKGMDFLGTTEEGFPQEIVILGSAFMSPVALDLLHRFSLKRKVIYCLYLPSPRLIGKQEDYWDWSSLLGSFKDWMLRRKVPEIQWLGSKELRASLHTWVLHRGKVPHLSFSNESKKNRTDQLTIEFEKSDSNNGRAQKIGFLPNEKPQPDGSFEIHRCVGGIREVQALRDRILHYIKDHPDANLRDIGVLAPNIGDYAPALEAVFRNPEEEPLPFNLVDLSFGGPSLIMEAFTGLLELSGSSWSVGTLIPLLENPVIQERYRITSGDLDLWKGFIQGSGIRWGWDIEHRKTLGFDLDDSGTWMFGFRRFLSGMARVPREQNWSHFPDTWRDIPLESIGVPQSQSIGRLMEILENWYKVLEIQSKEERSLLSWGRWTKDLLEGFMKPRFDEAKDERDYLALDGAIRELMQILNDLGDKAPKSVFDRNVFVQILQDKIRGLTTSKGLPWTEGITCCSIGPFRSMPFRVIALLGLDQASFPRGRSSLSLNLIGGSSTKAWMDPSASDLYSLLETMGNARDAFWIFFGGKDPQTGENLPISLPLEEMVGFLGPKALDKIWFDHPVLAASPKLYHSGNSGIMPSFSKSAYQELLARISKQSLEELSMVLEPDPSLQSNPKELTPIDFLRFIERPHQFFVQNILGIYLHGGKEQYGDLDLPSGLSPWLNTEIALSNLLHTGEAPVAQALKWLHGLGEMPLDLDRRYWAKSLESDLENLSLLPSEDDFSAWKTSVLLDSEPGASEPSLGPAKIGDMPIRGLLDRVMLDPTGTRIIFIRMDSQKEWNPKKPPATEFFLLWKHTALVWLLENARSQQGIKEGERIYTLAWFFENALLQYRFQPQDPSWYSRLTEIYESCFAQINQGPRVVLPGIIKEAQAAGHWPLDQSIYQEEIVDHYQREWGALSGSPHLELLWEEWQLPENAGVLLGDLLEIINDSWKSLEGIRYE